MNIPPVETTFDDGPVPRKSWVEWCLSVFRDFKYKGSGPTAGRPVNGLNIGDWFFDTTLNRPVFVTNTSPVTWVDIWANILTGLGVSTFFESAQQTITSAGALTIAHGLGKEPILFQVMLVNITAEAGYSIGDKVPIASANIAVGASSKGVVIVPDSINLNIRYADPGFVFDLTHKTTGSGTNLTNANWKVIFRAWA